MLLAGENASPGGTRRTIGSRSRFRAAAGRDGGGGGRDSDGRNLTGGTAGGVDRWNGCQQPALLGRYLIHINQAVDRRGVLIIFRIVTVIALVDRRNRLTTGIAQTAVDLPLDLGEVKLPIAV